MLLRGVLAAALGLSACAGAPVRAPVSAPAAGPPPKLARWVAVCRADAALADLAWLAGTWATLDAGNLTIETWNPPCAGTMVGHGQAVEGDVTTFHETLRIAAAGGEVVLHATPAGHPTVAFRRTEQGPNRVVFTNQQHDFPRTIAYTRQGDALRVRLEGHDTDLDADKVLELVFRRVD